MEIETRENLEMGNLRIVEADETIPFVLGHSCCPMPNVTGHIGYATCV